MRNALHALATLAGIALLIGTAVPAGAQDEMPGDGAETAPAEGAPEAAPSEPDPTEPDPTEPAPTEPDPTEPDPSEAVPVEPAPVEPEAPAPEPAPVAAPTAAPETTTEPAPEAAEASSSLSAPDAESAEPVTDDVAEGADEAGQEHAEDAGASEETEGASEEAAPAHHGPALSFANSFFTYTNAVTLHTFAPGAQLSYNPTWYMSFGLTPRFYLTDTTFLWLNQGLFLELTDGDGTTYNHEPVLTDTTLDLRQNIMWEGFVFQAQARVVFPLSKPSQAARRILQTGLGVSVARPFPELASFTVSASFGYRRWWATSNVAQIMPGAEPEYSTPDRGPACEAAVQSFCTQAGGSTTARDTIVTGVALSVMPFAGFTVQLSAFYLGVYGHEIVGTTVEGKVLIDDSPTHWRHATYLALQVGYDVLPYLNLALGIQNSGTAAPLYNPDTSVRSPFNPDTQVYLSATLGLDGVYGEIAGSNEDELTPEERQRRRQGLARRGGAAAF